MTEPQSSLARVQSPNPLDPDEMRAFAHWVWHERGIPVFLNIEQISSARARQAVHDAAEELYGKRADG